MERAQRLFADGKFAEAADEFALAYERHRFDAFLYNAAVAFDSLSCSSFVFTVEAPLPSFFLLHQMFDERWSVHVDNGPPQRPVLAGEFFMGLPNLDPGRHVVRFTFTEPLFTWSLAVSILTLAVLCILGVRQARRTPEAAHAG